EGGKGAAARRDECGFLLAQMQLLGGRAEDSHRTGRGDRRPSFGKRHRHQRRGNSTPSLGDETADGAERSATGNIAVGQREARRPAALPPPPPPRPMRPSLPPARPREPPHYGP